MVDRSEKTNAMRMLDSKGIPYVAHHYSSEARSAVEVAEAVGIPPGQVFKTLVVMPGDKRGSPVLAIVPGNSELDLKSLARAARGAGTKPKKLRMAMHREAESLTGLRVGGISALALLQKRLKVFVDDGAHAFDEILVSAGQRGTNLQLSVASLVELTNARVCHISRPPATPD